MTRGTKGTMQGRKKKFSTGLLGPLDESDQKQQKNRPKSGHNDMAHEAAGGDAQPAKDKATHHGPDNSHDNITQDAKALALDNGPGQPPDQGANS
jgi:hypothetical protein